MGGSLGKYILPGLETVGGGASEIFAPGNPIGLGLMGSGIGQLAGNASGVPGLGGALGGLGGAAGGLFGPGLYNQLFSPAGAATSQPMDTGATVGSQSPSTMTEQDIGPSGGNETGQFSEGQPSDMTEKDIGPAGGGELGPTSIVGGGPAAQGKGGLSGLLSDPLTMMLMFGPMGSVLSSLLGGGGGAGSPAQASPLTPMASPRLAQTALNAPLGGVRGAIQQGGAPAPVVPSTAPSMSALSPYDALLGGSSTAMSMAPPPGTMSATPQNPSFMNAFSQEMGQPAGLIPPYAGLIAYLRSQGMI